ncbi:hypothetical protein QJ850_gp626 [Acanthamoeba polyphaga mimivirus]|uniref:Uncharacterized protein n=1 Tax=Acanthamoeba polyphaga mimivirus Kroon TaxID=3069720 RepID=A0A0G2Y2U8_9VIRU|nr:hypothetical protein QJ850_gp626 [Acanthamoeba polyphaga mimivirus]AKI80073.1 hypothetical protein [Acanthamoeba polyphaga mimivirus Kroon]
MDIDLNNQTNNNELVVEETENPENSISTNIEDIKDIEDIGNVKTIKKISTKKISFYPCVFLDLTDSEISKYKEYIDKIYLEINQTDYFFENLSLSIKTNDYINFFNRLGQPHYLLMQKFDDKKIVGSTCVIMRIYVFKCGDKLSRIKYWYISDTRILQEFHKLDFNLKLFKQMYHKLRLKSNRFYTICVDKYQSYIDYLMDKLNIYFDVEFKKDKLLVFLVETTVLQSIEKYFICAYGDIKYMSIPNKTYHIGNKVIKNIYHMQHSRYSFDKSSNISELPVNSMVMFCFPEKSPLESIMENLHIKSLTTATILSIGMNFFDWHDILTSDIYHI